MNKGDLMLKLKTIEVKNKKKKVYFYKFDDMINKIKNENQSIVRYGDGEINLCVNIGIRFQKFDERLKNLLIKALNDKDEKLMICILPMLDKETKK